MYKKSVILTFFSLLVFSTNVYSQGISIDNNSLYSTDTLKKNADQAVSKKDYKKAVFLFEKLLKKLPNNEELRLKYASVLFLNKNYKEAGIQFEQIARTSKNPKYVNFSNKILAAINQVSPAHVKTLNSSTKGIVKNTENVVEINDSEEESFLCNEQSPTIFEDGSYLRWEKKDMPIKVYIPQLPESFGMGNSDKYISLVKNSMLKWVEKAPKYISFKFIDNSSEANISIEWLDSFKDEGTWGLASRPVYVDAVQKRESKIYLPVKAQAGTASFTNDAVLFSEDELSGIIIHETGHALGLGHSFMIKGNTDIMKPTTQLLFPGVKYEISKRDLNTLIKLYQLPAGSLGQCK
jgi:predicted Zn-dependent protease